MLVLDKRPMKHLITGGGHASPSKITSVMQTVPIQLFFSEFVLGNTALHALHAFRLNNKFAFSFQTSAKRRKAGIYVTRREARI